MASSDDLTRTLDHLLEGFQIISPDWTYLYVNPAAGQQGRRTPIELEGRRLWDAFPGVDRTPLFEVLKRVMETRVPTSFENLFEFPDGSARWFELRVEPVPQGICVHSMDIHQRKQAESALRMLNEQLEQRVLERTRELQAMNAELEAFCYSVSHDLRTPLRAIAGFGAILEETNARRLDAESLDHLARIRGAATRMGRLIDELLSFSRMGRRPVSRTDVDLSSLASSIAEDLGQAAPGRRVTWDIAPNLRAHCDPGLARIVLENLLGNAWKFTGRTPRARIEVRPSGDGSGAFAIADNGAGFDMQFSGSLFRPFSRLHAEREFPGNGIGLATVHRIVEKHGGTVRAESAVGQGAVFTVSLEPSVGSTLSAPHAP